MTTSSDCRPQRLHIKDAGGACVYVGRPSPLGNPWRVERCDDSWGAVCDDEVLPANTKAGAVRVAVEQYEKLLVHVLSGGASVFDRENLLSLLRSVGGFDVSCWCPAKSLCHGDVVIQYANHIDFDSYTDVGVRLFSVQVGPQQQTIMWTGDT